MQVKRNTFDFKILKIYDLQKNLTSFTLCWFYYSANGKLKLHVKLSRGVHISTTIWLWKIFMWSLYSYYILAAGKLKDIDSNKI